VLLNDKVCECHPLHHLVTEFRNNFGFVGLGKTS